MHLDDDLIQRAAQLHGVTPRAYELLVPLAVAIADALGDENTIHVTSRLDLPGAPARQASWKKWGRSSKLLPPERGPVWANKDGEFGRAVGIIGDHTEASWVTRIAPILRKQPPEHRSGFYGNRDILAEAKWKPDFTDPTAWTYFAQDVDRLRVWLERTVEYRTGAALQTEAESEFGRIMAALNAQAVREVMRSVRAIAEIHAQTPDVPTSHSAYRTPIPERTAVDRQMQRPPRSTGRESGVGTPDF